MARCSSFSSSSLLHSTFLMPGSSHSDHLALHCFGVLRASSDETRAHWFRPYLETAALRISSSMLVLFGGEVSQHEGYSQGRNDDDDDDDGMDGRMDGWTDVPDASLDDGHDAGMDRVE